MHNPLRPAGRKRPDVRCERQKQGWRDERAQPECPGGALDPRTRQRNGEACRGHSQSAGIDRKTHDGRCDRIGERQRRKNGLRGKQVHDGQGRRSQAMIALRLISDSCRREAFSATTESDMRRARTWMAGEPADGLSISPRDDRSPAARIEMPLRYDLDSLRLCRAQEVDAESSPSSVQTASTGAKPASAASDWKLSTVLYEFSVWMRSRRSGS